MCIAFYVARKLLHRSVLTNFYTMLSFVGQSVEYDKIVVDNMLEHKTKTFTMRELRIYHSDKVCDFFLCVLVLFCLTFFCNLWLVLKIILQLLFELIIFCVSCHIYS